MPKHPHEELALDRINVEGSTQMRQALDDDTIAEYAEAMAAFAVFPPVIVFFDGEAYWMGDGFHRHGAARLAGYQTIMAEVRPGGRRDALLYACSANASHGLRRTSEDKRKAVNTMLADAEWGEWSNREIAQHCGVDEKTVRSLRKIRSDDSDPERRYTTKHGTEATMDTSNISCQHYAHYEWPYCGSHYTSEHGHVCAGMAAAERNGEHGEDEADTSVEPAPDATTAVTLEEAWRKEYPEFVHPGIPADDFRLIAEKLDAMPPEQRLSFRERWRRHDMNALAELLGEPGFAEPDPAQMAGYEASDHWEKYFLDLSVLASSIQDGWGALMATWPRSRKQAALASLRQWHAWIGDWVHAVEEDLR